MPKIPWQDHLTPYHFMIVDYMQEQFSADLIKSNYLFFNPEYKSYLNKPLSKVAKRILYNAKDIPEEKINSRMKRLKTKRENIDYLFKLLPKFVHEQLDMKHSPRLSSRGMFRGAQQPSYIKLDNPKRTALTFSFQNILCLVMWEFTISELVDLATYGDNKSTFRLIHLNKQFLGARWIQERVEIAQRNRDKKFFNNLANAIKRDPPDKSSYKAKVGFTILLLWFFGFKDLTKPELLKYLKAKNIIISNMPQSSFNMIVTRLGLRKYKKV